MKFPQDGAIEKPNRAYTWLSMHDCKYFYKNVSEECLSEIAKASRLVNPFTKGFSDAEK